MFRIKYIMLCTLFIVLLQPAAAHADAPYNTYTFNHDGPIATQSAYLPAGVIDGYNIHEKDEQSGELKSVPLSKPEDIFIDGMDNVYIADTGNKRIVVLDKWGNYLRTVGKGILSRPTGVFVDDEGMIYVADYKEQKVFQFSGDGAMVKEYGKPTSHLFGNNNTFQPKKVIVDKRKNLYIVSEGAIHGLIQMSQEGEFIGYFGGNRTGFDLKRSLQRMFYTQEQLDKLMRKLPPSASNVAIDKEGLVYTSTTGLSRAGIKKLNVAGNNLLPTWLWSAFNIADITVSDKGNIYSVAEDGWISEYDQDGNTLFIFGGTDTGNQRLGLFSSPSGIAVNSDGRIFIVDKQRSNIQILKPTEFANLAHEAISLYADGKYAQSEEPWRQVLRLNSMFDLAHTGIGMVAYKQGDYASALEEFKLSNEKTQYSNTYWEIRRKWLMQHASKLMIGFVAFILGVFVLKRLYRKYGTGKQVVEAWKWFKKRKLISQLLHTFRMLRHPIDGYWELEAEGKASVLSATLLLIGLFFVRLFEIYYTNFLFTSVDVSHVDLMTEVYKTFIPFFTWVISNYLVSTINEGEGKFKDIYKGTIYALSPYLIFAVPLAVMSNGLTDMEFVVYDYARKGIFIWCAILIFIKIKEIHGYEIGETVKNILLTIFGMIVMALIAFIVFGLSNQVTDFMYSIFQEVKLRVQ